MSDTKIDVVRRNDWIFVYFVQGSNFYLHLKVPEWCAIHSWYDENVRTSRDGPLEPRYYIEFQTTGMTINAEYDNEARWKEILVEVNKAFTEATRERQ